MKNQSEFGFAPGVFNLMGERGAAVVEAEQTAVLVAEEPELPARPALKPLDVLKKLTDTINTMPATGQTDGDAKAEGRAS